jgi:spore coat protein CotH
MSLKFKRYYKLIVLLVLIALFFIAVLGNQRVIAYTVKGNDQIVQQQDNSYTNTVALFDNTTVHSIKIEIPEEDYQQMITTYQKTGEKDYFHANVIIDGVKISNVGLRLKGNASLRTAAGGSGGKGMGPDGEGGPGGVMPGDGAPLDQPNDANRPIPPDGQSFDPQNMPQPSNGDMPEPPQGMNPGEGAAGDQTTGESKLPLMIKFDEFVEDQSYQGYSTLAIRTYGISTDAAMLQEPVTNATARAVGLPATQTAYVGVQLNDGAEQLYTISEVINKTYLAQYFSNAKGVLYKAEQGADLTYLGEDPASYASVFTQQTRVKDADMAPLIAFLRFLNESDDTTFGNDLPAQFDVDAFATYLALNNLLVNTDSITGMNNNYYLYYDDTTKKFTLLMWDANESLGKLGGGGQAASFDISNTSQQNGGMHQGKSNVLVTRFLANATFKALYEQKLQKIYQQAFVSGEISQTIEQYAALIRQVNPQRNLVAQENYDAAVTKVQTFITQRSAYLAKTTLLGKSASTK